MGRCGGAFGFRHSVGSEAGRGNGRIEMLVCLRCQLQPTLSRDKGRVEAPINQPLPVFNSTEVGCHM